MLTSWHGLQAVGVLLMPFLRALHDVFWNCFGVVHAAKTVAFYETWQHAGRTVAMESVEVKTRIDNARLEKKYCQCVGRMVKQHNARCRVNCVVFFSIFSSLLTSIKIFRRKHYQNIQKQKRQTSPRVFLHGWVWDERFVFDWNRMANPHHRCLHGAPKFVTLTNELSSSKKTVKCILVLSGTFIL